MYENKTKMVYTVEQVAKMWGVHKNSIYNLIMAGQLNAFRVGVEGSKKPTWRIPQQALDEYITNNSIKQLVPVEVCYG